MSTRYKNGSHYENHQSAAELHDKAAHVHRVAADHRGQQDHETGEERSRKAREHSEQAYLHTRQSLTKTASVHGIAEFGHGETASLAHELWLERGSPEGSPDEDWARALEQLKGQAPGDKHQ